MSKYAITLCSSFLIILLAFVETSNFISYKKWKLFQIGPLNSTRQRNNFVEEIENLNDFRIIDILTENVEIGVGLLADRWKLKTLLQTFKVEAKLLHNDIGRLITDAKRKSRKRSIREDYFDSYMNIDQMEKFFRILANLYPRSIKLKTVGQSYEGRNISLFIISSDTTPVSVGCRQQQEQSTVTSNQLNRHQSFNNAELVRKVLLHRVQRRQRRFHRPFLRMRRKRRQRQLLNSSTTENDNKDYQVIYLSAGFFKKTLKKPTESVEEKEKFKKPIVFVDAGVHSREWVSPAAALYLIKKLAETPSLTSHLDWFVMPMVNPDGYKFSWENDRFWRKTRSKSGTSECFGADMNRNFDYHWGEVDTSRNPCSEHYGGQGPKSEVETEAIVRILSKKKDRLKAYISLHNWGQDILYPFCHSDEAIPSNDLELERVAKGMAEAIRKSQGTDYRTGRAASLLYPASGTSMDWVYDIGAPYAYLFELRDKHGVMGFVLPDIFIRPTGEDLFAAMRYFASELLKDSK